MRPVLGSVGRVARGRLHAFVGVGLLCLAWALANPMFAAPDEVWHVARAQSAWRGDITPPYSTDGVPVSEVFCMAFQPDVTADCMDLAWGEPTSEQLIPRTDGYPTAFYFIAGVPTRIVGGLSGAYAVRLWLGALCAAIVAFAVRRLQSCRDDDLGVVALMIVLTPMSVFLMSSVNPSGLSIAFGALAASAGLAWQSTRSRQDLVVLVVSVGLIVLLRRDGPIIGVLLLGTFLGPQLAGLFGAARARPVAALATVSGAVLGVAVASAASWGFIGRQLGKGAQWENWRILLSDIDGYLRQLVGNFGWLDTGVSEATMSMWFITAGIVLSVVMTQRNGPARQGAFLLAMCAVLPIAFGLFRGPYFQTRYVLPAFVAGFVIFAVSNVPCLHANPAWPRIRRVLALGVFAVHVTAFLTNMHRYSHGQTREWSLFANAAWEPPHIGNVGALVLGVAGSLAFASLILTGGWRSSVVPDVVDSESGEPLTQG